MAGIAPAVDDTLHGGTDELETPVSSAKRKLGEAISPESTEVSGKTTTKRKKTHFIGRKKKGLKGIAKVYKAKQSNHNNSLLIENDGEYDDYDTADELPLSGLVRGQLDPEESKPQTRSSGRGRGRGTVKKARRRVSETVNSELFAAITTIRDDIATMKIDGSKRAETLTSVSNRLDKLSGDSMNKESFDNTFGKVVTRIERVVDGQRKSIVENKGSIEEQGVKLDEHEESLKHQKKKLDDHQTTLEVHDARLTALEEDIKGDLQHYKKRLDGLEFRIDRAVPPPPLLPTQGREEAAHGKQLIDSYASAVVNGVKRAYTPINDRTGLVPQAPPIDNKSIIIEGLYENPMENLEEVVFDLLSEIGIRMTDCDYDKVTRLGRWNPARQWPRPIKLELMTTHKRNKILASRDILRETDDYYNVRIQQDEPKKMRVGRAMLRQAANRARLEGKSVFQTHDYIEIDRKRYDINSIQVKDAAGEEKVKPKNDATYEAQGPRQLHQPDKGEDPPMYQGETHVKYAEDLCTLDTPYGLAFFSIRSQLSNFFPCAISFNGRNYKSVEHGYQAEKAICANDHARLVKILNAGTPGEAKRIGWYVVVSTKWSHVKREVMRGLLYAKFTQHEKLGYYLCSTKGKKLIEGSTDDYWGAGVPLHSKEMAEGSWDGRNELGRLLVSIRKELLQEREAALIPPMENNGRDDPMDINLISLDEDDENARRLVGVDMTRNTERKVPPTPLMLRQTTKSGAAPPPPPPPTDPSQQVNSVMAGQPTIVTALLDLIMRYSDPGRVTDKPPLPPPPGEPNAIGMKTADPNC